MTMRRAVSIRSAPTVGLSILLLAFCAGPALLRTHSAVDRGSAPRAARAAEGRQVAGGVQKRARRRAHLPPPKVAAQLEIKSPPLSPDEEQRKFHLPEGFEIELVLAEREGIGKFVPLAFDAGGRLWTTTALEYPVDANDDPEASRRLFASGGRDKVLVLDDPYTRPGEVRVFADGLAIPLGVLPYRDGAFVQYGPDIRFYRDLDGDGKADRYDVVLTGFGTQDSHLFPHQFTRVPGGWILLAQGLFNSSVVRRGDGRPFDDGRDRVVFRHCKLARFRPDGSVFELLTAGPNNIWGLTVSREGEIWIQEANDLGYPIIPFEPGGYYRTGSTDLLKPYQPLMPPVLAPPQMGGTGLSGLALADDLDGWPSPWGRKGAGPGEPLRFYVANPVIGRIQTIEAVPVGNARYVYRKGPDFLACADPRFRPVAVLFGPDGGLYVVDWYNKIISHNEVPRNHPERDRLRGRIWRIRHRTQPRQRPPDLRKLPSHQLLDYLGADNARLAQLAWQEIVDRNARELIPRLRAIAADDAQRPDRRLGALWALEGLEAVSLALLEQLVRDPNPNVRYEAIRVAAEQRRPEHEFVELAEAVVDDPAPRVRAALGNGLRHMRLETLDGIKLLFRYAKPPLQTKDVWTRYYRDFERFLARWAMEENADRVAEFLESSQAAAYPLETRILAILAVGGREGARKLAELLPRLQRPLQDEELRLLAGHFDEPEVRRVIVAALQEPETQLSTLQALLRLRTDLDLSSLQPVIARILAAAWHEDRSNRKLLLEAAAAFRVRTLAEEITAMAADPKVDHDERRLALRALRQIEVGDAGPLLELLKREKDRELRSEVIAALAQSDRTEVVGALARLLPELNARERRLAVTWMSTTRAGASAVLERLETGDVDPLSVPIEALERMRLLLPQNATLRELWQELARQVTYVLDLKGRNEDYVDTDLTLDGPFTVEAWVRLRGDITNADGILGAPAQLDMNFYNRRFRVWVYGIHDIVIANREIRPDSWTHVAVTRDEAGRFRIYINGDLDAESTGVSRRKFVGLDIGRTIPPRVGTDGQLLEFRVWNRALSAQEIRERFDVTLQGADRPDGLLVYFAGQNWGKLHGHATVIPVLDGPMLMTAAEAAARLKQFDFYRSLVGQRADLQRGRKIFERTCLKCHSVANKGGDIGPPLDGIGLKGIDSILRNVLTPNAAVEGGYRAYRVLTMDGRIIQGLLVAQDDDGVVVRQPDAPDERIPWEQIERSGYTRVSVMPEGLLEALKPDEARDLLNYILTIR